MGGGSEADSAPSQPERDFLTLAGRGVRIDLVYADADPGLAELARWFGPNAEVKPCVGGTFDSTLDPGIHRQASIDVFEPGRRLRLVYLPPAGLPGCDGAMVDDFMLESEAGATIVRLLGSGVPHETPWDEYYLKLRVNSERALARLKVLMERKVPPPVVPGSC